jgi:hypothetical protein
MAFLIKSAGLVTTGTTGADLIVMEAAAGQKSTVLGLAGKDTIQAQAGLATATSLLIDGAADADSLTISGATTILSSSTIKGGAGGDTISITVSGLNASIMNAGDGNDLVTLSGGVNGKFSGASITLGAGKDSITVNSGQAFNNATLAAGSGADSIVLSVDETRSAQIFGGGGADVITISAGSNSTGLLINGDSTINGGGADTISINVLDDATIKGKGGKDRITVTGVVGTGTQVLGNAGADRIDVDGVAGSGNLIGGGSGNDSITLSAFGGGNTIVAGGGADSITISAAGTGVVNGGAGKDTITFAAVFSGSQAIGALSDSTLSKMDDYNFAGTQVAGSGALFTMSAVSKATLTTGVGGGSNFSGTTIYTGIISGGEFDTAGGVTARAAIVDAAGTAAGTVFVFEASGDNFLFIQGGSTGTSDDFVAKIGSGTVTTMTLGSGSIQL